MNNDRINELYYGKIYDLETQRLTRDRIHWICSQAVGEKVLDIGCSQGITCILLGRENFSCIGIDIEKDAIDYAKNELELEEKDTRERVEFLVCDASRLNFSDNYFDTVILSEILEHLIHPEKVLLEARRVLKERGTVIITVPFGLNSHVDHKKTYYPTIFLELVQPIFKLEFLDTMGNYIIFSGKKEIRIQPESLLSQVSNNDLIKINKKIEDRCYEKELKVEKLSEKLIELNHNLKNEHGKNKNIIEENKKLLLQKEEYLEKISLQEKIINRFELEMSNYNEINFEREKFQERIAELETKSYEHEIKYQNTLEYQDKVMKNSARWRIGSFFVGGINLILDVVLHPYSFFKQSKQRLQIFIEEVFPSNSKLFKKKVNLRRTSYP